MFYNRGIRDMKKISRINCAEGIFLPCFDMTLTDLNEFATTSCEIRQMWDSVSLESKDNKFSVIWNGDVVLDEYDTMLIFLNLPLYIKMDVSAIADNKEIFICSGISGDNAPVEAKGKLYKGAHITKLRLDFYCNDNNYNKHYITLYWIGALNSKEEYLIEEALPIYTEDSWAEYLNYNIIPETKNNILFSEEELLRIKKNAQEEKYKHFKDTFSKKADEICMVQSRKKK